MARIAGIDLLNEKRLDIALTYIYGIGRANVVKILDAAQVPPTAALKPSQMKK